MCPRASEGHLQKHLLLMFHNRHDGDEMRASPGTVLLFYGANLHCRCHRLSGALRNVWPLQSNLALLCSVRDESCT